VTAIDPALPLRADKHADDDAAKPSAGGLRAAVVASLALVALTVLAFWPVVDCGFVNFDDPQYVSENSFVQRGLSWAGVLWAFTTGTLGNYHPLTWLSLMLDRTLWGDGALGFHLTNVALHAANAVLLFLVLRTMTGSTWRSLLVAALFAVHPVRVESVAWVSGRKDCLSAFFGLLAIAAYVRYVARPSAARYVGVACLFAASLLCKAMFVTLPAVLLLLDHWPLRRARPWQALVIEKLPLAGVALAASVATFIVQHAGGAVGSIERYSLWQRATNAVVAYLRYLVKTVLPTDLAVFYPHPRTLQVAMLMSALVVLAAITSLAVARRRTAPWMLIGWLWFLGTLVPMIGFVQVGGHALADRYTYLPVIGLLIAVAWSLPPMRRTCAVASVLVLVTLTMTTRREIGHWRDSVTLWSRAIAVTENNYVAHTNLAVELARRGRDAEAETHYRAALGIRADWSTAHNGLGVLLAARGDTDGAIAAYESAIAARPGFALAHRNLGNQYSAQGRSADALRHYRRAAELRPSDAKAHLLLGLEVARGGDVAAARPHFQSAARLDPASRDANYYAGAALAQAGDLAAAAEHFRAVMRLAPDDRDARAALDQVTAAAAAAAAPAARTPSRSASVAE
jgi:tetratricopeptide (TPR) repeat protein